MLEGSLRFAVVVEAELIDGAVRDRPGVREIPLLKALADGGGKTRHIGAGGLELCEGQGHTMIVEIIVCAEILPVVDPNQRQAQIQTR